MKYDDGRALKPTSVEDYARIFSGVYLDKEKLSGILRASGFDVCNDNEEIFFDSNGKIYEIYSEEDFIDRKGDGGEFEYRTFLTREGRDVLFSRRFCSYITSADDYEDFCSFDGKDTYVLEENEVTNGIVLKIKEMVA